MGGGGINNKTMGSINVSNHIPVAWMIHNGLILKAIDLKQSPNWRLYFLPKVFPCDYKFCPFTKTKW